MAIVTDLNQTNVAELYVGFFNRAPLAEGMSYWTNLLANGATPQSLLADAIQFTPEYTTLYGGTPRQNVHTFYTHVFGREPLEAGLNYWSSLVTESNPFYNVAWQMIEAVRNGGTGIDPNDTLLVNNKIDVAKYYAIDLHGTNRDTANTAFVGVTQDRLTVDAKILEMTQASGTTYVMTANPDYIVCDIGNDLIIGTVGTTATNTYQTWDTINGGFGLDTLRLTVTGDDAQAPDVNNVEVVQLRSVAANAEIDVANIGGLTTIRAQNGIEDLLVTGAGAVNDFQIVSQTGDVDVVGGTATTLNLHAWNFAPTNGVEFVDNAFTSANITTISSEFTLAADDTDLVTASIATAGDNVIAAAALYGETTSLTITGSGSLDLTADGFAKLATLTAGAATTDISIEVDGLAAKAQTLVFGAGDDELAVASISGTKARSVLMGDGDDYVAIASGAINVDEDLFNGGLGFDTVDVVADDVALVQTDSFVDFDALGLYGTASADVLVDLTDQDFVQVDLTADLDMGGNNLEIAEWGNGLTVSVEAGSVVDGILAVLSVGTSDSVNFEFVGEADQTVALELINVETVSIATETADDNIEFIADMTGVKSLTLTGAGDVLAAIENTKLATLDASGVSGQLDLDLDAGTNTVNLTATFGDFAADSVIALNSTAALRETLVLTNVFTGDTGMAIENYSITVGATGDRLNLSAFNLGLDDLTFVTGGGNTTVSFDDASGNAVELVFAGITDQVQLATTFIL